jgi:hypothetical protein
MNPCTTKDRNVVGVQNDPQPETPKTAAEKAGFEPGESGNPSGLKQRGQNDLAGKSAETTNQVGSGFFMSSSQDKWRDNARVQNERAQDNHGGIVEAKMAPH